MNKTATVRARILPELKEHAETVFERIGLNPTQAITLFYKQVALRNGLPFDIAIPTPETAHTFAATDAGLELVFCEDTNDLFHKL